MRERVPHVTVCVLRIFHQRLGRKTVLTLIAPHRAHAMLVRKDTAVMGALLAPDVVKTILNRWQPEKMALRVEWAKQSPLPLLSQPVQRALMKRSACMLYSV